VTLGIASLTVFVLALSLPGALRDAYGRGGIYLFSRAFLDDIPKRLAGPGRFRFILQPLMRRSSASGAVWRMLGRGGRRTSRRS
jgi:hypothetical protein